MSSLGGIFDDEEAKVEQIAEKREYILDELWRHEGHIENIHERVM